MSAEAVSFNPFTATFDKEALMNNLNQIDSRDLRTRFKNTQDPITLAFKTFDNVPVKTLAKDFIKESFFDLVSFVTELCK